MGLRVLRGGMGGLTFPSAPSRAVGQLQQLINGAIESGRLPAGPYLDVNGKGDARLAAGIEAIEPGATTVEGALQALKRGGYKYINAQGLEEAPYQGGGTASSASKKKPGAKKKTTISVAKAAIMAPGVPWYRRPVTWIAGGAALALAWKFLGGGGAARRPFGHG